MRKMTAVLCGLMIAGSMQVGAEVYGHAGIEADLEIQALVLRSLALLGAPQAHLQGG